MKYLVLWLRAVRAPFFTASIVPVFLGTSAAGFEIGQINWGIFLLALVAVLGCHAGSNLINDYYDYLSDNDNLNRYRSPFNGGSGCIQEGLLLPSDVRKAALCCFVATLVSGTILLFASGILVLVMVMAGILSGYFYSGFPHLSYLGVGELLVGLNFGPLIVCACYFVQTGSFSLLCLVASVPIGLLVTAVLYINQFPDYEADQKCGKNNIVVRVGLKAALPYYYLLLGAAYLVVVAGVFVGLLPPATIVVCITLPMAAVAGLIAKRRHECPRKILSANALTIATHFGVGMLLSMVFAWHILALR